MTAAIGKSLGQVGYLDAGDMFREHVASYQSEPFGFGSGTRTALTRMIDGEPWHQVTHQSHGNGFAMKQSPLAYYFAITNQQSTMDRQILRLARVTHGHPVALTAAIVQNRLLVDLILSQDEQFDMALWLSRELDRVRDDEKDIS